MSRASFPSTGTGKNKSIWVGLWPVAMPLTRARLAAALALVPKDSRRLASGLPGASDPTVVSNAAVGRVIAVVAVTLAAPGGGVRLARMSEAVSCWADCTAWSWAAVSVLATVPPKRSIWVAIWARSVCSRCSRYSQPMPIA